MIHGKHFGPVQSSYRELCRSPDLSHLDAFFLLIFFFGLSSELWEFWRSWRKEEKPRWPAGSTGPLGQHLLLGLSFSPTSSRLCWEYTFWSMRREQSIQHDNFWQPWAAEHGDLWIVQSIGQIAKSRKDANLWDFYSNCNKWTSGMFLVPKPYQFNVKFRKSGWWERWPSHLPNHNAAEVWEKRVSEFNS